MNLVMGRLKQSTVRDLARLREHIQMDPSYQRTGDIWPLPRKQLLVDSVLKNFDVPKIYFRAFVPAQQIEGKLVSYAVIDGRQRLEALWAFLDDDLVLGSDAEVPDLPLADDEMASLKLSDLRNDWPRIAERFLSYRIDVVTVETDDDEIIEDMFLRLNEAAPLNAAEKRNAYGGPIPPVTRALCAAHPFFTGCLPYPNRRYRHYDIATKFLYFEDREGVADTKKSYLDRFVRDAHSRPPKTSEDWSQPVNQVLDALRKIFLDNDDLLSAVGMASVYYLVFRQALEDGWFGTIRREQFVAFEVNRAANRLAARLDEAEAEYDLLEFDRFAQSPNDAVALRFRRNVLLKYLGHPQEASGEDKQESTG